MREQGDVRRHAVAALFWSLVQNWGGRVLALVVFFILARLLSPADFGLASSAILIFSFVSLIAELGFGDALIQKPDLKDADANLPFYVAMATSVVLAIVAALAAGPLANAMGVEGLAPFIVAAAALSPLAVAGGFQEAMYRRALAFRRLAVRTLLSGMIGGAAGIAAALAGFGPWSLLIQFAFQLIVSLVWVWARPVWVPSLSLRVAGFREIGRFGLNVVAMRLVDFVAMRTVDLLILVTLGPAALGLFAVSSRLYQFMMQLLQASISNVALAMLSKISDDRARMARLFILTTSLSAMLCSPVFFGLAALAPEASTIMFGAHWTGADAIMTPLLLVGGVHCLLFGAGAYLTALGHPHTLLRLMILKAGLVLIPLALIRPVGVDAVAVWFAAGLLAEAPFTIHATLKALSLRWIDIARPVGVPLLACLAAFLSVRGVRQGADLQFGPIGDAAIYALVFISVYLLFMASFSLKYTVNNIKIIFHSFRH